MAEVTRRRTGELLRKLFEILMANPEGIAAKDALAKLVRQSKLSPYEAGEYKDGSRRFEKIVRFATVDLVKAGWMQKDTGLWTITEAGRAALRRFTDPEKFHREAVRLYHEWKNAQPEEEGGEADAGLSLLEDDAVSEREVAITIEEAQETAWQEIERRLLHHINPYEFQELVAALLKAMGYHVSWIAPPGRDGGIDIVAFTDPLGTRPPRIKVQVKRQQDRVTVEGLRALLGLLCDEDIGIFVATGGFTKDAEVQARSQERRRVTLIDMKKFVDLWIEHYKLLDEVARQRLPLKPIYFLSLVD